MIRFELGDKVFVRNKCFKPVRGKAGIIKGRSTNTMYVVEFYAPVVIKKYLSYNSLSITRRYLKKVLGKSSKLKKWRNKNV